MNTANKLTILRVLMIPLFMLVLYLGIPGANYWALIIFAAASLTDMLDGYIARHYNQVTDFGKFMDPLADKCLVTAAMVWFVEIGQMPGWAENGTNMIVSRGIGNSILPFRVNNRPEVILIELES